MSATRTLHVLVDGAPVECAVHSAQSADELVAIVLARSAAGGGGGGGGGATPAAGFAIYAEYPNGVRGAARARRLRAGPAERVQATACAHRCAPAGGRASALGQC